MTLNDLLKDIDYKNHIILLTPSKIDDSIKWNKIIECEFTDENKNMILEKYGSWIVFNNVSKNDGKCAVTIYHDSMNDIIAKFN